MNGLLNIYKEKGYTSHDVVAKLRGICHMKKIGHTGTLDPDAEGVLPVCLGSATKLCELLTDKEKAYRAVLLLGLETDTQDIGGQVLRRSTVGVGPEDVKAAIASFVGEYAQIPPMYSAIKVNGKKLYELARAGIEVERKPRQVHIFDIHIEEISLPRVTMTVECSKGTYIRTLCHDIGEKLGCGGCMESLLRIRSGMFELGTAYRLEQIRELADQSRLDEVLIPTEAVFMQYPAYYVKEEYQKRFENGNGLPQEAILPVDDHGGGEHGLFYDNGMARLYDGSQGFLEFFGIYSYDEKKQEYKPWKIFHVQNNLPNQIRK